MSEARPVTDPWLIKTSSKPPCVGVTSKRGSCKGQQEREGGNSGRHSVLMYVTRVLQSEVKEHSNEHTKTRWAMQGEREKQNIGEFVAILNVTAGPTDPSINNLNPLSLFCLYFPKIPTAIDLGSYNGVTAHRHCCCFHHFCCFLFFAAIKVGFSSKLFVSVTNFAPCTQGYF